MGTFQSRRFSIIGIPREKQLIRLPILIDNHIHGLPPLDRFEDFELILGFGTHRFPPFKIRSLTPATSIASLKKNVATFAKSAAHVACAFADGCAVIFQTSKQSSISVEPVLL